MDRGYHLRQPLTARRVVESVVGSVLGFGGFAALQGFGGDRLSMFSWVMVLGGLAYRTDLPPQIGIRLKRGAPLPEGIAGLVLVERVGDEEQVLAR